jgi:RNA polymerase sigma factor (TIGR02999 family)
VSESDVTRILEDSADGDDRAADALMQAVYGELRDMAEAKLAHEPPSGTLQPTALVHEAYLRLVDQTRVDWQGRTHFKAIAAQAMQRALIDYARRRKRQKRGGGWQRVALDDAYALARDDDGLDAEALHAAIEEMRTLDERQAKVVEYRVFGGLTAEETARLLDVSARTVERDWKMGRAWLRMQLSKVGEGDDE